MHEALKKDLIEAMKARDEVRVRTIRSILAAVTNELVSKKQRPDVIAEDELVLTVLIRAKKQRQESIEQFEKAGRTELSDTEKEELIVIEAYLPAQMTKEEIEKIVLKKKDELGVSTKADMGTLMGAVMTELKGKADGGDVKEVVDASLS